MPIVACRGQEKGKQHKRKHGAQTDGAHCTLGNRKARKEGDCTPYMRDTFSLCRYSGGQQQYSIR